MSYDYLPGVLAEIAEVAGLDAALQLADAKGGSRAHFPSHARHGHWLTDLVGLDAAKKICDHFRTGTSDTNRTGGHEELIPLGPKNMYQKAYRQFRRLVGDGMSVEAAARQLGVHLRTTRRWRAKERKAPDARQGRLF